MFVELQVFLLSRETIIFPVAVSSHFSVEELLVLVSVDEYDIVLDVSLYDFVVVFSLFVFRTGLGLGQHFRSSRFLLESRLWTKFEDLVQPIDLQAPE